VVGTVAEERSSKKKMVVICNSWSNSHNTELDREDEEEEEDKDWGHRNTLQVSDPH
jgi:hypothetical protein